MSFRVAYSTLDKDRVLGIIERQLKILEVMSAPPPMVLSGAAPKMDLPTSRYCKDCITSGRKCAACSEKENGS